MLFRSLLKSPGFTVTVLLTLALGIGANTAIFSVVYAVLLSPLPYPHADRLVAVQSRNQSQHVEGSSFAPAGFRDFEKQVTTFEKVAAERYNYTNLTRIEKPTLLTDGVVTQDFFEVLGVKPLLGRTFIPEDAGAGAKPTVVLGYRLWQNQFGGRANLIGETIMLDDVPHIVIGVMPGTFKEPLDIAGSWRVFPNTGGENLAATSRFWNVIGRLKPQVPQSTVQAELGTIAARLAQSDRAFYAGWDFTLQPMRDLVVGNYRDGLLLVIGAALLVTLITCANVAGLLLVRASTRQRDTAVRLSLGASRWTIVRGCLVETFVLVALGCGLGIVFAQWGLDLLLASLSSGWIPRADEIAINAPVLITTGVVALLTGIAAGVYPALRAARIDAMDALRAGTKATVGPQSTRLRASLVAGQIALTLVLLVCAGLVLRSFAAIVRVAPGMQTENILSLDLSLPLRLDTPQKRADYFGAVIERVQQSPGITSAAFTQTMPFRWGLPVTFSLPGHTSDAEKLPPAFYDSVSPSFFSTTHIPLIAGRTFTSADRRDSPPVVVVSQAAAKKFFGEINPIGQRLILPGNAQLAELSLEVIGVVGDVPRNGLSAATPYQVYASMEQRPWFFATLLVRAALPVEIVTETVQRQIWSLNPDQPVSGIALVKDLVRRSLTQPQLYVTLFSLFAILALFLAALGLYGLIAYSVAQRTREFGIRVALGAQTENILRLVLSQGVCLTAIGLVVGLIGALIAARLMQALLFHTAAYDPWVFVTVMVVLVVVSLLAALLPAHRAARVDPLAALRAE
jgi:predicted permease